MKREVERERTIPAFAIGLGELENLWERLVALFDDPNKIHCAIELELPSEKLQFTTIDELKQYPGLKGRVTKFSLWLSKDGRRVSIRAATFANSQMLVWATGDTEAWCAGAIETAYSFLQSYKVWYRWLVAAPIGWILFFLANVPTIARLVLPKDTVGDAAFIGWLATMIALALLFISKKKLFPAASLQITNEESFIRRYSAELGLLVALLPAVLTVVGWFLKGQGAQ